MGSEDSMDKEMDKVVDYFVNEVGFKLMNHNKPKESVLSNLMPKKKKDKEHKSHKQEENKSDD